MFPIKIHNKIYIHPFQIASQKGIWKYFSDSDKESENDNDNDNDSDSDKEWENIEIHNSKNITNNQSKIINNFK